MKLNTRRILKNVEVKIYIAVTIFPVTSNTSNRSTELDKYSVLDLIDRYCMYNVLKYKMFLYFRDANFNAHNVSCRRGINFSVKKNNKTLFSQNDIRLVIFCGDSRTMDR